MVFVDLFRIKKNDIYCFNLSFIYFYIYVLLLIFINVLLINLFNDGNCFGLILINMYICKYMYKIN